MRKIAFTIDTEKDFGKSSYQDIKANLPKLANLLKKKNVYATFFVTSDCLKKEPSIFKRLQKEGHEIALHGYMHERWDILSKEEKEENLDKAVAVYKKIFGKLPKGFRAPQFSLDFELVRLLDKKGFAYDSSIVQFPISQVIFFPSRFMLYLKQCFIRTRIKTNELKISEVPVSSFGLPISMFTLRKLPRWIFSMMNELAYIFGNRRIVFLSHSYELDKKGLGRIESYFEKYKNARFTTIGELAK